MKRIKNGLRRIAQSVRKAFTTAPDAPERPNQWKIPEYYVEVFALDRSSKRQVAEIEEMRRQLFKLIAAAPSPDRAAQLNRIEDRIHTLLLRAQTSAALVALELIVIEGCPGIKSRSHWSPGFAWANRCFSARATARQQCERVETDAQGARAELAKARRVSRGLSEEDSEPDNAQASDEDALARLRSLQQKRESRWQ